MFNPVGCNISTANRWNFFAWLGKITKVVATVFIFLAKLSNITSFKRVRDDF